MRNILKFLLLSTVLTGCLVSNNSEAGFFDMFSKKDKAEESKEKKKDDKSSDKHESDNKLESKDTKGENKQSTPDEKPASIEEQKEGKEVKDNSTDDKDVVIKFKDGTKIKKSAILEELNDVSGQAQQKMSFNDLMLLFEVKQAYEKVITDEAKNKKLHEDEDVKKTLKDRQKAVGTYNFLNEQTEKLITKEKLKKFYDDTWEKHIKGTNQISLVLIQVADQKAAEKIKNEVKSEKDLNNIIKELQSKEKNNIATIPLEDYPESALPPEIIKEMKSKGENSIIGPFPIQGVFTLFFIKSFHKAKKKEFSDEMLPQIKQLASKEFSDEYIGSLIEKHKVEMYDLNGSKVDFKIKDKDKKDSKNNKKAPMLSQIKDDQVIAKIGDKKLTIKEIYNMFNIKSLDNEIFGSLAMQLRISIEEVIQNAIRICIQDKLLSMEMEKVNYMETDKMKKICKEVEKQHLRNAYFAKTVKITDADAKKEYNKYIKMLKPEEKDDNEISVKLMFYKTEKEAEAAIKEYKGKPKKFTEDFKTRSTAKDKALDLGYIKRQEVPQQLWDVIKKCTPGTCVDKVMQMDGSAYGFDGNNFAIAHIGDRRPIKLPTFQETAQMFRKVAEKMQAISICDELLLKNVTSIDGKSYKSIPEEMRHKLLIAVIQGDNRSDQGNTGEM